MKEMGCVEENCKKSVANSICFHVNNDNFGFFHNHTLSFARFFSNHSKSTFDFSKDHFNTKYLCFYCRKYKLGTVENAP